MEHANTICAKEEGAWDTVESVIGDVALLYAEYRDCECDITMCHDTFNIKFSTGEVDLACKEMSKQLFLKAKFLYEQVQVFPNIECLGA